MLRRIHFLPWLRSLGAILALSAFLPQSTCAQIINNFKDQSFTTDKADLHVTIHYGIAGKGEPVIEINPILGGTRSQCISMTGIMRYRVILPDCRGQGESTKFFEPDQYGPEMVKDMIRLLDHLHIRKAHIVGLGMGAAIAGNLLLNYPDRVLSAVLIGGGPFTIRSFQRDRSFQELLIQTVNFLEKEKSLLAIWWMPNYQNQTKLPREFIVTAGQSEMASDEEISEPLAAMLLAWPQLAVKDSKLPANKVPTLMIVGSRDPAKPDVDYLKAHMAHLELVQVESTTSQNTSVYFSWRVRKFLREHSGSEAVKLRLEDYPEWVRTAAHEMAAKYRRSKHYGLGATRSLRSAELRAAEIIYRNYTETPEGDH